jgi:hypothetical protein
MREDVRRRQQSLEMRRKRDVHVGLILQSDPGQGIEPLTKNIVNGLLVDSSVPFAVAGYERYAA